MIELNLELAWKRIKQDLKHRVFIRNPFDVKLVEYNLSDYLNRLNEKIIKGNYHPKPLYICNVPKGKGLVRPGAELVIDDKLVYYACLGSSLAHILETLIWSQNKIEYSYQISGDNESIKWLKDPFDGWNNFRKKSLEYINTNESISHVIFADISGYYENIDILYLISDLRGSRISEKIISILSECLNRWAQVTGRGIPQGFSPSDLLGKIYLNTVDLNLMSEGFKHLRYVDDFRIFCNSESDAKRALIYLSMFLRKRGLNLQSAKTEIITREKSITKIEGIQTILQPILDKYKDNIIRSLELERSYISLQQADEMLAKIGDKTPIEVIRDAFNKHIINTNIHDKTLFHFLLNRLGRSEDCFAYSYSLGMLKSNPEETENILNYIKSINAIEKSEEHLIDFVQTSDSVYTYQVYQIMEWFSKNLKNPSDRLISLARNTAFNASRPKYLRSICRKIIGDFGGTADLERLEQIYADTNDEKEKSEIICCLKRMEPSRRNSILKRASHDGASIYAACRLVKTGKV